MNLKEKLEQHQAGLLKRAEEYEKEKKQKQTCERCGSDRVAYIGGHQSDLGDFHYKDITHEGYLPYLDGLCGGDDINIHVCLECGQVKGNFPIAEVEIERWREEQEYD